MNDSQLQKTLSSINWDFPGSVSPYGLHRLHWYPATFTPQIPAFLIELFSKPAEYVLDPFCGVGTTLVEAVRLGRTAIGVDLNPIATMVSRAKLTFFDQDFLQRAYARLNALLDNACVEYGLHGDSALFSGLRRRRPRLKLTDFDSLIPWYHPETLREMVAIRGLLDRETGEFRTLCDAVFSQIAKPCSSQREHWGYVADNMAPTSFVYQDAINAFRTGLRDAIDAQRRFLEAPLLKDIPVSELNGRVRIVTTDVLKGSIGPDDCADLIVTSPPYLSVTDYIRSQRLSLWWLRASVEDLRKDEIGARFKRNRQNAIDDYMAEMTWCVGSMARVLKVGGYMCLVVGESDAQRVRFQIVDKLRQLIIEQGFTEPFGKIKRSRIRERIRSRKGSTSDEFILVFRKK